MNPGADLFLGCFSLTSPPPRERAQAAARAGFGSLSLSWAELAARRAAGEDLARAGQELRDAGLAANQLEIIPLAPPEGLGAFRALAEDVACTARGLGCKVVHAVARDTTRAPGDFTESFAALADACAAEGLDCAVEFVPHITAIPDLASALGLVHAIGRPNAGIVIDSLHFHRSGAPWAELAAIRAADVASIQLNDGPLRPPVDDYYAECMQLRRPPGEGEFDLARMLDLLHAAGVRVPLTVEVMSDELNALPPAAAAGRLADSMRGMLTAYRPMAAAGSGRRYEGDARERDL